MEVHTVKAKLMRIAIALSALASLALTTGAGWRW
jgi:hypothetical protein